MLRIVAALESRSAAEDTVGSAVMTSRVDIAIAEVLRRYSSEELGVRSPRRFGWIKDGVMFLTAVRRTWKRVYSVVSFSSSSRLAH